MNRLLVFMLLCGCADPSTPEEIGAAKRRRGVAPSVPDPADPMPLQPVADARLPAMDALPLAVDQRPVEVVRLDSAQDSRAPRDPAPDTAPDLMASRPCRTLQACCVQVGAYYAVGSVGKPTEQLWCESYFETGAPERCCPRAVIENYSPPVTPLFPACSRDAFVAAGCTSL